MILYLVGESRHPAAALVHERDRGDDDGGVAEVAGSEDRVDDQRLPEARRRRQHDALAGEQPLIHQGLLCVEDDVLVEQPVRPVRLVCHPVGDGQLQHVAQVRVQAVLAHERLEQILQRGGDFVAAGQQTDEQLAGRVAVRERGLPRERGEYVKRGPAGQIALPDGAVRAAQGQRHGASSVSRASRSAALSASGIRKSRTVTGRSLSSPSRKSSHARRASASTAARYSGHVRS
jgi:hypothetical protein